MKTLPISNKKKFVKTTLYVFLFLSLGFLTNQMHSQSTERTVSGVVMTSEGPLPYAAVILKGTSIGVATDENGAFTFPQKLKENDVILISFLGYKNREITMNASSNYIKPFLEDIPLIILAASRTAPLQKPITNNEN